jgi:predicted O-methyltransferase YrrM
MIVTDAVEAYLERVRSTPDGVVSEMEDHARRDGIPVVVPATGRLLQVLALACDARRAVEVGTAIGVSTLYIARGLSSGGQITSFEIDPDRHAAARDYLGRAGVSDRVDLRLQDAREGLESLSGPFDFAFLDGVKAQYDDYFSLVWPLLGSGAVLAVDNVLMGGFVAEGEASERIASARAFNERLLSQPGLTGTVTPVGDGVLVAVKA